MSGIKKNSKGQLHQGTKIEARKPLDVPVHTSSTTSTVPGETINLNYGTIKWTYTQH